MNLEQSHDILDRIVDEHEPVHIYACFSGGHDSLASTHLAMDHFPSAEVLHLNTGIGVPQTRTFVRETCDEQGWPLVELHAKEDRGEDYDDLVRNWGFPGPPQHIKMYSRLKERCIYEACVRAKEDEGRYDSVLFVTGIRADESQVRSGYKRVSSKVRAQVWVNPMYYWSAWDMQRYREAHSLPENEVCYKLGMSGECLCGAYARPGELSRIRSVCPKIADRLERLDEETTERGMPWGYEGRPSKKWLQEREGQRSFSDRLVEVGRALSKGPHWASTADVTEQEQKMFERHMAAAGFEDPDAFAAWRRSRLEAEAKAETGDLFQPMCHDCGKVA
jgi:3'-phosphoadenosine 5'-phosphosulfate sulfotransferase (PAPS reductase)/FAD synthetase